MPLLEQIQKDMVAAMKAKDEAKLSTVRMIKTALMKVQIDGMKPLDEAAEMQVLNTLVKQRKDSIEMFRKGNREELARKEESELKQIEGYLPAGATEADMDEAIAASIAETGITSLKQMGAVMNAAKAKLAGKRIDGQALSGRVKAKLS